MTTDSPAPESAPYARTLPVHQLRTSWQACVRAAEMGAHQLVTYRGAERCALVPHRWYMQARKAVAAPEATVMPSAPARDGISGVTRDVAAGAHVLVTVDGYERLAVVPVQWRAEAVAAVPPEPLSGDLPPLKS